MRITTFDLPRLAQEIQANQDEADDIEGQCHCGEWARQTGAFCPLGHPIAWKGSKIWNQLFLEPRDDSDTFLLKVAHTSRFKNGREYHRWRRIKRELDWRTIRETIGRCAKVLYERNGFSPRALVKYALNALDLKIEETPEDDDQDYDF